ncbi:hypothetical protein [Haliangium sp.]|uniref:hypothetical protein n=1 Tax=Haliangium sp. TaxID=2663208 RepID=UPI003D10CBC9
MTRQAIFVHTIAAALAVGLASAPTWAQERPPESEEGVGPGRVTGSAPGQDEAEPGSAEGNASSNADAEAPDAGERGGGTGAPSGGSGGSSGSGQAAAANLIVQVGTRAGRWGGGASPAERRSARDLFLEANEMVRQRYFAIAVDKFQEAIALWNHPAFHHNQAIAHINLDQPIEAYEALERAVEHGPAPLGEVRYQQARRHLTLLGERLVRIQIACPEPGAQVLLDSRILFTGPGEYQGLVRPGVHQIVATKPGLPPDLEQPVLSAGETRRIEIGRWNREIEVMERRWGAWVPWVAVSAGAAVVLGAGYLDWRSSTDFDRFDRDFRGQCPGGCQDAQVERETRGYLDLGEDRQRLSALSYAVGGAALITGGVLLYLNRERPVLRKALELERVSITPRVGVDHVYLDLNIGF